MSKAELLTSDAELQSLTNAIKCRYGIDFTTYEPKSMKRGFSRLVMKNKFDSILDLWSKIMSDRNFFTLCIDDLMVTMTELFRNPEIWMKLKEVLLINYGSKSKINMWHAGCSSGEEVYTMAIVLDHLNLLRQTNTLATDLSAKILDKAKIGKYNAAIIPQYNKSFSTFLPNGLFSDSFDLCDNYGTIKLSLKKHIEFKKHNLVQDSMFRKFDIVFCRNVMIYFDNNLKNKVLKLFYDSLEDDGFFIVGYYDMLPPESKELFEVYDRKTRIYKKIKK